ncbi:MAG: type IV pilus modification protein PilV [Pseudomonadota bacterium]
MTLIEVLIAMLILAIGVLGAAGIQLNALKYTDSALKSTQASFIAYDLLDRMRANAGSSSVVSQDLSDFKRNIRQFAGETGNGTVAVSNGRVSISIQWSDTRAEQRDGSMKSFVLSSQLVADTPVAVS